MYTGKHRFILSFFLISWFCLTAVLVVAQGHQLGDESHYHDHHHSPQAEETQDIFIMRVDRALQRAQEVLNRTPRRAKRIAHRTLRKSYRKGYVLGKAKAHQIIGQACVLLGMHEQALVHFLKGLGTYQDQEDWRGIAHTYNHISVLYRQQQRFNKTLEYAEYALDLAEKFQYKEEIAWAYNNMAIVYLHKKDYINTLQYLKNAIRLRQELHLNEGLIISYNNMGLTLRRLGRYEEALDWYDKSLHINQGTSTVKHMQTATFDNIGDVLTEQKKYTAARKYYDKALKVAREAGVNFRMMEVYQSLYKLAKQQENDKEALLFYTKYTQLKDSIMNLNIDVKMASLQHRFRHEKERRERIFLKKDVDLQRAIIRRHKVISWSTVGGFALMFLLAFVLYQSRRKERKARQLLGYQAEEISEVNRLLVKSREKLLTKTEMLTLRNQQVTTSIRAARMIQTAILPVEKRMKTVLGDYFLIYLPKDIVSGDFYWVYTIGQVRYVAVVDCTGHGVAGSLMVMLGYALLNEIVNKGTEAPAQILKELNEMLTISLRQDVTKNQSGLDIILCKIQPVTSPADTPQYRMTHASSRRPLYYTQQQLLVRVKGDKQFIGGNFSRYAPRPFTEKSVVLDQGETLYLTTDGFADTPNENRESFGSHRLFEWLDRYNHLPLSEQKEMLVNVRDAYQKGIEQRDDITILGFKL